MHTTLHHKMQYATQYHTCSRKSKRPFSVWKQSDIIRLQIWFQKVIFHLVVYVGCLLFFASVLPNTIVIIVRNSNFFSCIPAATISTTISHTYHQTDFYTHTWYLQNLHGQFIAVKLQSISASQPASISIKCSNVHIATYKKRKGRWMW